MCTPNSGVIEHSYIHAIVLTHHLFITMFCRQHGMFPKTASSLMLVRYFSNLNLNQISLLMKGGFCQLAQNDRTHRSIFTFSVKFCLQESCLSEQFLEGRKQPWIFFEQRSKILHNRLFNFSESTFRSREGGFVFSK